MTPGVLGRTLAHEYRPRSIDHSKTVEDPNGFRKVEEENPFVWVCSYGLDRDERVVREQLTERLKGKTGGWLNEDSGRDAPAGRYIRTHGDRERLELAHSPEAIAAFAKEILPPILALGDDIEEALRAAS